MTQAFVQIFSDMESLQRFLQGLIFLAGLECLFLLVGSLRRNPPDTSTLSAQLQSRGWRGTDVFILVGTLLLLYTLAAGIGSFFYEEQLPVVRLVVGLLVDILLLAEIILLFRFRYTLSWSEGLGLRRTKKVISRILFFYLALLPLIALSAMLSQWILKGWSGSTPAPQPVLAPMGSESPGWLRAAYIFFGIFIAPPFEEIFFRGVLFPALARKLGVWQGAVLISLFFAAIHMHLPSFAPLFLLSLGLCAAYWRSGSLWIPIGMHMLQNSLAILSFNLFGSP